MTDTQSVLLWWGVIFILGLITYPLSRIIFSRFIDKGYLFSKVFGIFFVSYLIWLLGILKIVPFYRESIFLILLILGAANLWWYLKTKNQKEPAEEKGVSLTFAVIEEIVFFASLAFWAYVKAHEPSIRGLEKFMDFGFVESILRSTYFPPLDMWLTRSPGYTGGYFINYYYFGHLITAVLTKLSGINSVVTYNLMIATLFAFTFSLSFSIGTNIIFFLLQKIHSQLSINYKLILIGGFLTAFIVALGGNLHMIYTFTTGYPNDKPTPFWELPFGSFHPESYWYPNATRFIPYTIHEFPIYSFVVSDLHGHVSDIPFVLLVLALLLNLLIKETDGLKSGGTPSAHLRQTKSGALAGGEERQDLFWTMNLKLPIWLNSFLQEFQERTSVSFPYLFLLSLLIAVMYMTNAVDGPIYIILTGLVILFLNWKKTHELKNTFLKTFSASLFIVFFFLLGSLPFSVFFKPFGTGIGVLCAPVALLGGKFGPFLFEQGKCQKSPIWMLAVLWGFFYFNVISFLLLVVFPHAKNLAKHLQDKALNSKHLILNTTDIFVILTSIISTLLLIFPEFFYIKDIYPMHYRANTMFKFGYQAFIMLGIDSAYIFIRIKFLEGGFKKSVYYFLFSVLFFLIAIYPFFAINSYFGGLKTNYGLDGLQWMKKEYPEDYNAVIWLRNNITGQPVILEANGESYTDYARISANTGLPTVIGWPVHEWLWRGSYDEAGRRIPEVQALYESKDIYQTKTLLQKYNISYVFMGVLERQKYPNLDENKWNNLGSLVFENGTTKIYKIIR